MNDIQQKIKNNFLRILRKYINNEIDIKSLYRAQEHLKIASKNYDEFIVEMKHLKFDFYKKLHDRLLRIESLINEDATEIDEELVKKHSRIVGLTRRVMVNENGSFPAYPTEEMLEHQDNNNN